MVLVIIFKTDPNLPVKNNLSAIVSHGEAQRKKSRGHFVKSVNFNQNFTLLFSILFLDSALWWWWRWWWWFKLLNFQFVLILSLNDWHTRIFNVLQELAHSLQLGTTSTLIMVSEQHIQYKIGFRSLKQQCNNQQIIFTPASFSTCHFKRWLVIFPVVYLLRPSSPSDKK